MCHPTCPICQAELKHIEDGCMTDRGWKDESYFICPTHGEVDEEDPPGTAGFQPALQKAIESLNLTKEDLLTFQREMARQGRNWQLTLVCAQEAGVPTYHLLMAYTQATRPPSFF